jgi:hypothetical protein
VRTDLTDDKDGVRNTSRLRKSSTAISRLAYAMSRMPVGRTLWEHAREVDDVLSSDNTHRQRGWVGQARDGIGVVSYD